ncbi:MAG TPA: hypothetical protein V6D00_06280 [Pantanalinema sp.]
MIDSNVFLSGLFWGSLVGSLVLAPSAEAAPVPSEQKEDPLPLSLAYFGETGYHPGVALGVERALWQAGESQLYLSGGAGGYTHSRSHNALFLAGELGYRLGLPLGLSADVSAGAGVMHVRLDGEVFSPSAAGSVDPVGDGGHAALMPMVGFGLGYDLGRLGLQGQRAFFKLQAFGEYPVNTNLLPHLAAQVGLQWKLRN